MLFGNWEVTDNTIEWRGNGTNAFVIPSDQLNKTTQNIADHTIYYNFILLATAEEWLTQNDLFDLNYAFVYAIAKFGLDFNYDIFDATLAEQYEQFETEDDEDFEL